MKKSKIIIIAIAIVVSVFASSGVSRAQVATSNETVLRDLLIQVINLLMKQVEILQAQLAAIQNISVPAPVASPQVSLPLALATSSAEAPVISLTSTFLTGDKAGSSEGQWRIEWLATQKDKDPVTCSSPELGKLGMQGAIFRKFSPGSYVFNFSCVDQVSFKESHASTTVRAE